MNLQDPTQQAVQTINPQTPSGSYGDPVQVGQMIQQMYPQYKSFDAATIGQRWIALHTPKPTGVGSSTILQPPTLGDGTMQNNTPDLSGLSAFASPIKNDKKPAQSKSISVTVPQAPGMNQLTQGNQLAQVNNNAPSWLGNQVAGIGNKIASYWQAPKLQATDISRMNFGG